VRRHRYFGARRRARLILLPLWSILSRRTRRRAVAPPSALSSPKVPRQRSAPTPSRCSDRLGCLCSPAMRTKVRAIIDDMKLAKLVNVTFDEILAEARRRAPLTTPHPSPWPVEPDPIPAKAMCSCGHSHEKHDRKGRCLVPEGVMAFGYTALCSCECFALKTVEVI
jgi:hypothetical protein